jgi:thioesterase domain-containing protein
MISPSHWRVLRDGSGDLVLGISFDTGRGESLLTDLAARLEGHPLWEAVPPRLADVDPAQGLDGYLAGLNGDLLAGGDGVAAVIGHCAGASLAAALAARLRKAGLGRVALILVDPAVIDAHAIATEYLLALRTLAAHLPAEDLLRAQLAADGEQSPDLLSMLHRLDSAYRVAMAAVSQRLPISEEYQDQLCTRLGSYLSYLTASAWAHDCAAASAITPAVTVLPAANPTGSASSNASPPTDNPSGAVRFGTDSAHLLGDPALARLVTETLSR